MVETGFETMAPGKLEIAYFDTLEDWYGDEGKVHELIELANKSDAETAEKIMKQIDDMNAYLEELELTYTAAKEIQDERYAEGNTTDITGQEVEARKEKIKTEREAIKAAEEEAKAQEALANPIKNTIEKLKGLDGAFDIVNKGIDEFKEEGKLSYETIAELQEQFGEAEEGMTEFYEGLANGTITLDEYKAKMSELIVQEMSEKILKGELNGANKAMIESFLKTKGVTNAAEVAQSAYNLALAKSKIASMELDEENDTLSNSLNTLAKETGLAKDALFKLIIQEKILNNSKLSLKDKITELNKLKKKAEDTGLAFGFLNSVMSIPSNAFTKYGNVKLSYITDSLGYEMVSPGKNPKSAIGATFLDPISYQPVSFDAIVKKHIYDPRNFQVKNEDIGLGDINLDGTPGDDDKGDEKDPVEIDWVSARLGEAAKETSWRQKRLEEYQEDLDFLDEEKGQFEEILQKNNDILWVINQLKDVYDKRKSAQSSIFDQTMASYKSAYGFNFDKDTVLSWFTAEGEQSLAFSNLLLSKSSSPEMQEALQTYWDDIKKIIDDVTNLNDELKELDSLETDTLNNIYDTNINKITADIEKLEYANETLERSSYMDYYALRKNNEALQDLYMTLYRLAIEEGREADAREHLAKWWDSEADIVKSISEEFDKYRETYDAIAEEMKKREEEAIESLDYQIQRLQYRNTLTQNYNTALNTLRTTQHEINKELRNSMLSEKYLSEQEKEKIFNAKDYLILSKEISKIEEEIQDNYIKYQNKIKKLEDDQLYRADLLTKQFEAQTAEKQKALEILKMEIDLVKKRQALTDALQEKNVRVYQGGQWIQIANYNAVQTAAEALAETEYQIAEKKIQNAQTLELTENEMRIAQLEEKKKVHEAEIKAIDDMTQVLEDAKTKWETGFDATATSAKDLSKAFYAAKEYLNSGEASIFSYNNRDSTSGARFSSSKEGQDLYAIYKQKVDYETSTDDDYKATVSAIASSIRNNSSSAAVKATANMSVYQMKEKYGFAAGTNNTPAGTARVNEKGLELYATNSGHFIELNPHGKIFNNDQFNYLYTLSRGKTSIDANRNGAGTLSIGQMTLALPNVTDTPSFVEGLEHLNEYIRNTMKF